MFKEKKRIKLNFRLIFYLRSKKKIVSIFINKGFFRYTRIENSKLNDKIVKNFIFKISYLIQDQSSSNHIVLPLINKSYMSMF